MDRTLGEGFRMCWGGPFRSGQARVLAHHWLLGHGAPGVPVPTSPEVGGADAAAGGQASDGKASFLLKGRPAKPPMGAQGTRGKHVGR